MTKQQRSTLQAATPFIIYYQRNQCLPSYAPHVPTVLQNAYKSFNPLAAPIDFTCSPCVKQGMDALARHLELLNSTTKQA